MPSHADTRAALAAAAFALLATPAFDATISEGARGEGRPVLLSASSFTGSGPCGTGKSVVGDGCSVVLKTDPSAVDAYGRFDPYEGSWIDSQDLSGVAWDYQSETPFSSLTFALTDARDQVHSFFRLLVDDASWSIPAREANGTVHWLTVSFDAPVTSALLRFETRYNDGFGVSLAALDAPPAPVPLPASGVLLVGGLAGLAGLRIRRRMVPLGGEPTLDVLLPLNPDVLLLPGADVIEGIWTDVTPVEPGEGRAV